MMSTSLHHNDVARSLQSAIYYPTGTVRCDGPTIFRSQFARDIACLLDLDPRVTSWSCMAFQLSRGAQVHSPDFLVDRDHETVLVDAHVGQGADCPPDWAHDAARAVDYVYEVIEPKSLPAVRLRNAKDLLRYARFHVALSDRVRLLAALDEQSSLTVAECLPIFQETRPIGGLASLVLHRFIDMDLDEQLIGPETQVRRFRD